MKLHKKFLDKAVETIALLLSKKTNFLMHLIAAFVLPKNVSRLMKGTGEYRCAITGVLLLSQEQIDQYNVEVAKYTLSHTQQEVESFKNSYHPSYVYGNQAFQSTTSDKLLSAEAVEAVRRYVAGEVDKGNAELSKFVNAVAGIKAVNNSTQSLSEQPALQELRHRLDEGTEPAVEDTLEDDVVAHLMELKSEEPVVEVTQKPARKVRTKKELA